MTTELERCYLAALRILGYRFNSEAELRRKLARKKFDQETVEATLARLRAESLLDDERYAGAYVRTRTLKTVGRMRIRRELIAAGVDEETAERAVRENVSAEAEEERLRAAYEKLAARLGEEQRDKIAARLLRQGFAMSAVRSLVWRGISPALPSPCSRLSCSRLPCSRLPRSRAPVLSCSARFSVRPCPRSGGWRPRHTKGAR